MGLFDTLLKKGHCSLCGAEINVFNEVALKDGKLCKRCRQKLSPYYVFTETRGTLDAVKEHLAYRQRNAERAQQFQVQHVVELYRKTLYIDQTHGWFCIASGVPSAATNPDIFELRWLTACNVSADESKIEVQRYEGDKMVSYNPPRYNYYLRMNISFYFKGCPLASRITETYANDFSQGSRPASFDETKAAANKARDLLLSLRDQTVQAPPPKHTVTCPFCGAPTIPDAQNRCEYCMSTLQSR